MCGIAGIFNLNKEEVSEKSLKDMADVQAHRGPDDSGIWKDNFTPHQGTGAELAQAPQKSISGAGFIGFSHRRLSIIDLSDKAHQPMCDHEQNIWMVFNGEIFNYIELREELKTKGHIFKSDTDSEVVIYAYKEWGIDCVNKFNGMWAFALWDYTRRQLFCSRDRFGVKPFYYYFDSKRFLFSSEIKALLKVLPEENKPFYPYLYRFLVTGLMDDSSHTFFKNIKQLEPAHSLLVNTDGLKIWRYWDYNDEEVKSKYDYSNPEKTFIDLLTDSVRLRLRSDVPVGTCLSGGLDSSSIVTFASGLMENRMHTFSSMYADKDCDESYYIDIAVKHNQAISEFIHPNAEDFMEIIKKIVWHQDEPTGGPGLYSQWHVMKLAQNKVKVLLDGQGGDELLGGYHYYFTAYLINLIREVKKKKKLSGVKKIIKEYKEIKDLTGQDYHEGLIEILRQILLPRFLNNLLRMPKIKFKLKQIIHSGLYHTEFTKLIKDSPLDYTRGRKFEDELNNTLYWSLTKESLPTLLHFEDRNSMAFSIEARTPFLDYRLVEFGMGLPSEEKISGTDTKVIMRKALKDILPSEIVNRRDKKGYPTPFARWIRESLGKPIKEILLSEESKNRKIFNLQGLEKRLNAHISGKVDCSWEIWRWLTTELWFRIFID